MKKLSCPMQSQFGEGECDSCIVSAIKEVHEVILIDHPEWFENGKLTLKFLDIYNKKSRSELNSRINKVPVWYVSCGFCDEPFGLCSKHLKECLKQLEDYETSEIKKLLS